MEVLDILIPLFTAVLVAFMTFFFTRSHYERKRRDDLADREFIRRAAIYDMRIQEARHYVDTFNTLIHSMNQFHNLCRDKPILIGEHMRHLPENYPDLASTIRRSTEKVTFFTLLDDSELTALHQELLELMGPRALAFADLLSRYATKSKLDVEDVDLEIIAVPTEAYRLITKMKKRLDELAETVK